MDVEGVVTKVVFRNPVSGWSVVRLESPAFGPVTAVGTLQPLAPGEHVRMHGRWVDDPKHGRQLRADTCLQIAPSTVAGMEKYLGSGMIPGIGKELARRIVARFGPDTLRVLENHPGRLAAVPGIGKKRAESISKALAEKRAVHNIMIFLESAGVSPAYAQRIFRRYGQQSIVKVRENPYRLAEDIHGIGFKMADAIASHLGIPPDSPHRAEAGLLYVLSECAKSGHCYCPQEALVAQAQELLSVDGDLVLRALDALALRGAVRLEDDADRPVYLPALYRAEQRAAHHLVRLIRSAKKPLPRKRGAREDLVLAPEQQRAVDAFFDAAVTVVTGGPGTGKTTLLRVLLQQVGSGPRVRLAAPTGRAAKRMSESTGLEAVTLHRLLEFTPQTGSFARNEGHPLDVDVVVIDEMSMVDMELFSALVAALPDGARLVLLGDPDQLPSVGPGEVLAQLLALERALAPRMAVVRLHRIFRQARSSLIVTGAHDILAGRVPTWGGKGDDADFFFVERADPAACVDVICHLVAQRIPGAFGLDPVEDVQVLTPMHKGELGAGHLNEVLQRLLNPRAEADAGRFSAGDKVMQVRNNYDLEVFNGDVGKVVDVDAESGHVRVHFGYTTATYAPGDLDQLTLAYATSIHKSQGSEYPAVVIPVHTQHYVMLQRNLLYTAVTRGKRLVVLVGSRNALHLALRNDRVQRRFTRWATLVERAARGGRAAAT